MLKKDLERHCQQQQELIIQLTGTLRDTSSMLELVEKQINEISNPIVQVVNSANRIVAALEEKGYAEPSDTPAEGSTEPGQ